MSYSPIERTLLMLDESEKGRMRCKYDSCYLGITFEKYVVLYELGAHHDADLGHAYKTAPSVKLFMHYALIPSHNPKVSSSFKPSLAS